MKIVKKTKMALAFLFVTVMSISSRSADSGYEIDVMVDFGYPIFMMQSIRQDLNQAVYACQQKKHESVLLMLNDALSKLNSQVSMNVDDIAYIKAMIDQINVLMETTENDQDRSLILEVCQQIYVCL